MSDFPSATALREARVAVQQQLAYHAALGVLGDVLEIYDKAARAYEGLQTAQEHLMVAVADAQRLLGELRQRERDDVQAMAERRQALQAEYAAELAQLHSNREQARAVLARLQVDITRTQETLAAVKQAAQAEVTAAVQQTRAQLEAETATLVQAKARTETELQGLRQQRDDLVAEVAQMQRRWEQAQVDFAVRT